MSTRAAMPFSPTVEMLGFPPVQDVAGRGSIAIEFAGRKRRSGIYLLFLEGEQFYIGKTNDVVRRFGQHRRYFGERLVGFSFQPFPPRDLEKRERTLIQCAEHAGLPLEQSVWKSVTYGDSDLDSLLTESEYTAWNSAPQAFFDSDQRLKRNLEAGRASRDHRNFARFRTRVDAHDVLAILRTYTRLCVPASKRTEHDFWSVACMPSTNASYWPRLFCVSAHVMELFVLGHKKHLPSDIWGFLVCAESPLLRHYGSRKRLRAQLPVDEVQTSTYRSAGHDQVRLHFSGLAPVRDLLQNPVITEASGLLLFRVMRKGVSRYANFHNFALADAVLGDEP